MSLSNPRSQSPVQKFFRVNGGSGTVSHYDKAAGKEIVAELPFRFIVLDVVNVIGGFHEASNSGIWSNEFRNSTTDQITVRTKSGILLDGTYSAIKETLRAKGGKFGNNVYIAYREGGELALGRLSLIGAAVSAWFDFQKGRFLDVQPGVGISEFTPEKKGRTEYFVPVFQGLDVSPADLATAQALDETLQTHLSATLSRNSEPEEPRSESEPEQMTFSSPATRADWDEEPPF